MVTDTKDVVDPYDQFQPEDRVKHPVFGEGQIIERRGSGKDTKLLVRFAEEGEKRLMAVHAKLKKIRPVETEGEKPREAVKEAPKPPVREPKPAKDLDLDEEDADIEVADDEDLDDDFDDDDVDVDEPEEEV